MRFTFNFSSGPTQPMYNRKSENVWKNTEKSIKTFNLKINGRNSFSMTTKHFQCYGWLNIFQGFFDFFTTQNE